MPMRKSQYELIARVLHSVKPEIVPERTDDVQWERTCLAFLNHFTNDNPQFDRERFMLACKGEKHGPRKS